MTFTWDIPPWQRNEDCTHMATTLTNVGGGQIAVNTESVRGENAGEALADLLMGPGGGGGMAPSAGLVGVVIKRGIDVMWMAQPPIRISLSTEGDWDLAIEGVGDSGVTVFSPDEASDLLIRLRAEYGPEE
ncbi:hypothetical protein ABT246_38010 [Streptomyces sp. NPDC001553]|uniref:hypothetical protein n=1 Tax=Streptomyces sp. NPDC001553 TaxID=3154385 RepID=UPI0033266C15